MIRRVTIMPLLWCTLSVLQPSAPSCAAPWNSPLKIALAAADDDSRIPLVHESVHFWNGILEAAGASFRLGPVRRETVPEIHAVLRAMSAGKLESGQTFPCPSFLDGMETDLLIILTDADIVSFTEHWEERGKAMIVIKSDKTPPLSLPNVSRNVIAHELGHVIGLEHNADATTLMCGRPSFCRPDAFASPSSHFLPLTGEEKALLRSLYPAPAEEAEIYSNSIPVDNN